MKYTTLFALAAAILTLAGCSSTPTNVDKGTIRARSFSFVNPGNRAASSEYRQGVHRVIQDAITQKLAASGITRTPQGGDVTVAYLVILGNGVTTERVDEYFGAGGDAAELTEMAHSSYTKTKNPNQFEAGTLVIDILDSHTFKLLRRNSATRQTLRTASPEARTAGIQEAVNAVLQGVQFTP